MNLEEDTVYSDVTIILYPGYTLPVAPLNFLPHKLQYGECGDKTAVLLGISYCLLIIPDPPSGILKVYSTLALDTVTDIGLDGGEREMGGGSSPLTGKRLVSAPFHGNQRKPMN